MLEAYHSVIMGKNRARTLTKSNSHVLEHGELIVVGACTYVFDYTDFSRTPDFETDLSKFAKEHFGSQSLHRYLTLTSVGDPVMLGTYYCSPSAFAKGTFGKVTAGWASNGAAVAIKTFKEPNENVIKAHKEIMRFIGRHVSHNIDVASDYTNSKQDNIVELVHCVSHFNASVPDAYCVYTPLAVASLSDLIISYEVDIHAQITLLGAYANGLSYLHDKKGIMHGDISPNNLAVISFDPPQGMIIDLDTATKSPTSTQHYNGAIPLLAPEIMALKLDGSATPFDRSVDVWALGLSMLCLYFRRFIRWKDSSDKFETRLKNGVNKPCYEGFQRKLETIRTSIAADLVFYLDALEAMVEWEPDERVSIGKVLDAISISAQGLPKGNISAKKGTKRSLEE